ncbi:RNA-binding protein 27 [Acipenser ruthenus]|uniref:RNA-binding protein 27 n=1 Tax=Acipenser ruthenus TaxID=7906 RepID=A0A444UXV4_ACIRT|nr:RNA-binding protein 27 [Acipenser ruthenus]
MIIEDVEALKSWLSKLLQPICDADPSALANYVVALVKKDKPPKDLKALCADQLDVFLQKETTGFVDKLFEGLTTKNYLGNQDQLAKEAAKVEMKTGGQKMEENKEVTVSLEEERDGRRKKSPLRNRPDPNEMRNRDDKRRDDRKRRDCDRHNKNSDPYRERYDRRRGTSRGRSFSRSRSRSGSRGKSGDRDHSRAKERGFCVRGDLCPFDHGNDPLIVDDVTLPTMIPFPPPPGLPPPGLPMPPMPGMPPNLRLPIPPHGQPPPPGIFPMPGPPLIPTCAINNREHSGTSSVSTLAPTGVGPAPPLPPRPSIPPHPQYTLAESANIVIQTEPSASALTNNNLSRFSSDQDNRKRPLAVTDAPPTKKSWLEKQNFNNQHKPGFQKKNHYAYANTKLEVRKIPRDINNIAKLNEHFSKFGTIVNIQVMNKLLNPGSYSLNKMKTRPGAMAVNKADPLHTGFIQTSASAEVSQGLNTSASHLKAVYSSSVMKMTSKPMAKSTKALEAHEAMKKKQETLKLQQDMRKKKQEMLEKQIECQKAQKELLDAEMDFHKKLSSGEDTTDLKKKLGQLQVEAARLGLIPTGRGKAPPVRGRGRGRGRSVRGRGVMNHMVVDHRPRALAILGVTKEEKEELMPHFVKFGEVEELHDYDATSIVVTFRTRSEAENAANQGAKFKGRTLQISWYKPKTPSISTEPDEEEAKEEEVGSTLLPEEEEEDDDEEDEDESRSWRR